jgi:anti-sigma factor RsiW
MDEFDAVVGASTLRSMAGDVVRFAHRWTSAGVTVETSFTGAHLLHLAVAGCVLNDVFREAERLGVIVHGVRVTASGGFDTETWESTGIGYVVDVDSPASAGELDALLFTVDSVAEIPKSIRAGAPVERMDAC